MSYGRSYTMYMLYTLYMLLYILTISYTIYIVIYNDVYLLYHRYNTIYLISALDDLCQGGPAEDLQAAGRGTQRRAAGGGAALAAARAPRGGASGAEPGRPRWREVDLHVVVIYIYMIIYIIYI